MTSPLTISVVTPSFNQGRFLEETIRSVVNQSYPNVEYVVIDGGSTDESVGIIERYRDHLSHWCSEPDHGHAHALNKGFAHTSGEVMAWINSDDKYHPGAFNVVAEIFERFPKVDWITGKPSVWDSKGRLQSVHPLYRNSFDYMLGKLGDGQWIQQESVFWRRKLWDQAGGRMAEDIEFAIDTELWCRFFTHARLHHVDCVISGFRSHGENRSIDNANRYLAEANEAVDTMRRQCSANDRSQLRQLAQIHQLKGIPLLGKLPFNAIGRRVFPEAYQFAAYPVILNDEGGWRLVDVSFSA